MINSKKLFQAIICFMMIQCFNANAQTNVGGGIFTNTTWTLANSPYIVIDTTVVFPGVTLTIEPGVTVKFDNQMYLEMRQATLIAIGTITDSITFTSNSLTPTPGSWGHNSEGGIWLNGISGACSFNFCNVEYATAGLGHVSAIQYIKNSRFTDNLTGIDNIANTPLDSCIFKFNTTGINIFHGSTLNYCTISNNTSGVETFYNASLNNCRIDSNQWALGGFLGDIDNTQLHNCFIRHNQHGVGTGTPGGWVLIQGCVIDSNSMSGINIGSGGQDSIINCEIKFNGIGLAANFGSPGLLTLCDIEYNAIGIYINGGLNIYCNKICNNTSYGLQMNISGNFNVANNYWCTTDSASIAAVIYDGYDNANFGLVTFLPVDSTCYPSTGTALNEIKQFLVAVFPNPVFDKLNVTVNDNVISEIILYDIASKKLLQKKFTNSVTLNIEQLAKGIYLYEVRNKNGVVKEGKVVKE